MLGPPPTEAGTQQGGLSLLRAGLPVPQQGEDRCEVKNQCGPRGSPGPVLKPSTNSVSIPLSWLVAFGVNSARQHPSDPQIPAPPGSEGSRGCSESLREAKRQASSSQNTPCARR